MRDNSAPSSHDDIFVARAQSYIDKIQQNNIAMGMRKATIQECAKAVKMAADAALKVVRGNNTH